MRAEPLTTGTPAPFRRSRQDHWLVRGGLTVATLLVIGVLIVIPVVSVFALALAKGLGEYWLPTIESVAGPLIPSASGG